MNKILSIVLLFLFISPVSFAEPSAFGLEIKKTTYEDVKKKYLGRDVGINKYSLGKMYDINRSNLDIGGMKSMRVIFNKNDELIAIITNFQKHRYGSLVNSLKNKYELISQTDEVAVDKSAKFQDGNTHISINAPHMSFDLKLVYIHKDFNELLRK